jgi:hypothetical protein
MLLFKLPISNTDNRPLELEVQAPPAAADPEQKLIFELDI